MAAVARRRRPPLAPLVTLLAAAPRQEEAPQRLEEAPQLEEERLWRRAQGAQEWRRAPRLEASEWGVLMTNFVEHLCDLQVGAPESAAGSDLRITDLPLTFGPAIPIARAAVA